MPSITKGNKLIFDETDFLAGLHPQYTTSGTDTPAVKITNKLAHQIALNPYRHLGYASPGFDGADATNVAVITSEILNGAIGYEGSTAYAYLISNSNLLHQYNPTTNAITNAGIWPYTIVGTTAESGSDVIVYSSKVAGTSQRNLFFSYNDSGAAWNVGIYKLDNAAPDPDFMSTVPATPLSPVGKTEPHPMFVGDDDILYIADGNKLHAYDGQTGTNGTFSDSVLTLPTDMRITSFAKHPTERKLVLFAYFDYRGTLGTTTLEQSVSTAYTWDYLSLDITDPYPLEDNAVTAAFNYKGTMGCFTQGREPEFDGDNRFSKLKLFNGLGFDTVQNFIGNAPVHGGVDISDSAIRWNSQGIMHQYGSPYEGMPIGMNKVAAGDGTFSGMCKIFSTTSGPIMCSGTITNGGLQKFKSNYAASSQLATAIAEPIFPEGKKGRVKTITVHFGKVSSVGRSLNAWVSGNDTSASQFISNLIEVEAGSLVKKYKATTSGGTLPKFQDLRVIFQWQAGTAAVDAPVIQKVEIEYETINIEST